MTINGINGTNTPAGQMGMNQATDSYSRNIQNQIANAQKQLQKLSSNEDMTLEEKMKKRQEIQQQISDLNAQLRQHQAELRKEKQQVTGSSMNDASAGTRNAEIKSTGLSQMSMTAILSADSSLKQAKVQGSVAASLEGKARILKSEIKTSYGVSLEKKKEELADIEQKAQAAASSQLSTIADAIKTIEDVAKEESKSEKTDDKDAQTAGAKEKGSEENVSDVESIDTQAAESPAAPQTTTYKSIDIRL